MDTTNLSLHSTKWAVFAISMMTSLAGVALLILGIYALSDTTTTLGNRTIPEMLLILGCLVFLVSFLGCFGTLMEHRTILWGFIVGLIVLVSVQLVLSILALSNKGAVDTLMDDAWQRAWDHHPRILRDVQEEFGCCGFRYTTDRAIPKSSPDACLKSIEFGYQTSCYRTLIKRYNGIQTTLGVVGLVLSAIQLFAVFLSWILAHHLPSKDGQFAPRTIGYAGLSQDENRPLLEEESGILGFEKENDTSAGDNQVVLPSTRIGKTSKGGRTSTYKFDDTKGTASSTPIESSGAK
jgi:uncharacterized membrane protein YsdA (DUF1294 family)